MNPAYRSSTFFNQGYIYRLYTTMQGFLSRRLYKVKSRDYFSHLMHVIYFSHLDRQG